MLPIFRTTKRKADTDAANAQNAKKQKKSSLIPWNTTSTPYSELAKLLDECAAINDDDENTTMLAAFFEQVLRYSPNDLHHCVKLLLSGSYDTVRKRVFVSIIASESNKTFIAEESDSQKADFVGWVERAKQVKSRVQPKFTFGRPQTQSRTNPLTVEEVARCIDEMDRIPKGHTAKGVSVRRANLAIPIFKRCNRVEAGALMTSLGGNKTPFNRKFIFHSLAEAYTNINGSGFRGKKKAKFYEWVYVNIVVSFETDKDICRTVETFAKDGINEFPF